MNREEINNRLNVVVKFLQRQGAKSTVPVPGHRRVYRIADLVEAIEAVKTKTNATLPGENHGENKTAAR